MKRYLRLFIITLLCALSSAAWGQTPKVTLDFTTNDVWQLPEGSSNKGTTAASFTNGEYTITLQAESSGYYFGTSLGSSCLMLGKKDATLTLPAFDFKVGKIAVTGTSGASTAVKQNIFVGDEAVSTETTGAMDVPNEYAILSAYQAAGTIYVFKVNSNHNTKISKIEIYESDGSVIKFNPEMAADNIIVAEGEKNAVNINTKSDGVLTLKSCDESVAKVIGSGSAFEVVGVSAGSATITVSQAATTIYEAAETSFNVNVYTYVEPGDYATVNMPYLVDFTKSQNLFVVEDVTNDLGTAIWTQDSNNGMTATTYLKLTGEVNKTNHDGESWLVSPIIDLSMSSTVFLTFRDNWNSYFVDYENDFGVYVREVGGSWTKLAIIYEKPSLSFTGCYEVVDLSSYAGKKIQVGYHYVGHAASAGTYEVQSFSVTAETLGVKQLARLSYGEENTFIVTLGEDYSLPTLSNPNNLRVSYISSNTDVATINETGIITLIGKGKTIIKATFEGNDNYLAGEASYTLLAKEPRILSDDTSFYETFDNLSGTGGCDGVFSGVGGGGFNNNITDESWTSTTNSYAASQCAKVGTSSKASTLTTSAINMTGEGTLTFLAAGWGTGTNTLTVSATGATLDGDTQITLTNGEWNTYTVSISGAQGNVFITFAGMRGFIDEIKVTNENASNLADPELSYAEPAKFDAILGESFTTPTLNNPHGVTVTYSSSNEKVATVNASTGAVTLVGAGETIITASSEKTDTYKAGFASYTLTVTEASVQTLADIAALSSQTTNGTYEVTFNNVVVTYVNGNYAYMQDASGAIVLYKSGHGLSAGQVLNGIAEVAYQVRNGNPQITSLAGVSTSDGTAPEPKTVAASAWSTPIATVLNQYFKVTRATITQDGNKYCVQLGSENVQLYGQGDARIISVPDLSTTYTIIGFPTMYNTTPELHIFVQPEPRVLPEGTFFFETFDELSGPGGRDGVFSKVGGDGLNNADGTNTTDESWTSTTYSYAASQCAKIGAGAASTLTTRAINMTGEGTLTFEAAGWGTGTNTLNVSAIGATLVGDTQITLTNGEWNTYIVSISGAQGEVFITFAGKRGFIDEIQVTTVRVAPELSYDEPTTFTATLGEAFTAPPLNNPHGVTVTYSSSNESVATVDAQTGAVTLVAAGKTTIKAIFKGNDVYYAGSASYSLTVILADPELSYDEPAKFTAALGVDFTAPILNNPHGLSVTYSSSNQSVAKVDANTGEITLVAEGETTISASFMGNDIYYAASASYTLTVIRTNVTVTIPEEGVTTYCPSYDLDFSGVTDFKAYVAASYDSGTVFLKQVDSAPAGLGLYLQGTPGEYVVSIKATTECEASLLVGTTTGWQIRGLEGNMTNLVLERFFNDNDLPHDPDPEDNPPASAPRKKHVPTQVKGNTKFYPITGEYISMPANSAWLQLPTSICSVEEVSVGFLEDDPNFDLNHDGRITVTDVMMLVKIVMNN